MSTYGALMGGAIGVVIAVNRIAAFRRQQAAEQGSARIRAELAVRDALVEPEALSVEVFSDGFSVSATFVGHDSEVVADAVKRVIPHFTASAYGTRPVSSSIRRQIRRGFPNFPVPESITFYRMPLQYRASNNDTDASAFSAFLHKVRNLPRLVSLGDLSKNAEAAFLETRPEGFDFQAYYRSNR